MKRLFFFSIPVLLFSLFFILALPAYAFSVGASPSSLRAEMLVGETGEHEIFFSILGGASNSSFVLEKEGEASEFLFFEEENFTLSEGENSKYLTAVFDTEGAEVGHYEGVLSILYEVPASNASIGVRYGVSIALFLDVVDELSDVEVINGVTNSSVADQSQITVPEADIEKQGEESQLIIGAELTNGSTHRVKSLPYTIEFLQKEEGGEVSRFSEEFIYYETLASGESVLVEQEFTVPDEIGFGSYRVIVSAGENAESVDLRLIDPIYYVALGIVVFLAVALLGTGYYLHTHRKKQKRKKVKKKTKKKK